MAMKSEQHPQNEERFNERLDLLEKVIYLGLYYTLRHIRRHWIISLISGIITITFTAIAMKSLVPVIWPVTVAIATLIYNLYFIARNEHGKPHVHTYSFNQALKYCNLSNGEMYRRPQFISKRELENEDVEIIVDASIPEDIWRRPDIESRFCGAFNVRNFREVKRDNRNRIHLILASGRLHRPNPGITPEIVDGQLPIGQGSDGLIYWNIFSQPHLLISGMTGSGKSTLLRWMLFCLGSTNAEIFLIDPKMGVDYISVRQYIKQPIATDLSTAFPILESAWALHQERLKHLVDIGLSSLYEAHKMGELLDQAMTCVVIDEYLVFASGSREKSVKESAQNCLSLIERLAVAGRATGIHLILSTQYPTADLIGSQVKQQLYRISGRLEDEVASRTILGLSGAESIPSGDYGHFVYRSGDELKHFYGFSK